MKQEMMGCQWQQLDHMQIICTLLQTDNYASTSSVSMPDALRDAQPTASKHCGSEMQKLKVLVNRSFSLIESSLKLCFLSSAEMLLPTLGVFSMTNLWAHFSCCVAVLMIKF